MKAGRKTNEETSRNQVGSMRMFSNVSNNKDSGVVIAGGSNIGSMTNILVVPQESEPLVNITEYGVVDRTPKATHSNSKMLSITPHEVPSHLKRESVETLRPLRDSLTAQNYGCSVDKQSNDKASDIENWKLLSDRSLITKRMQEPRKVKLRVQKSSELSHFPTRADSRLLTTVQRQGRPQYFTGETRFVAQKPKICVRCCHKKYPPLSREDWRLSGFNKWRLGQKEAKQLYRAHRAGANTSLTKVQANQVRHKQFLAFFADFFDQPNQKAVTTSPHFEEIGFPQNPDERDEIMEMYFDKYFQPPQKRDRESTYAGGSQLESSIGGDDIIHERLSPLRPKSSNLANSYRQRRPLIALNTMSKFHPKPSNQVPVSPCDTSVQSPLARAPNIRGVTNQRTKKFMKNVGQHQVTSDLPVQFLGKSPGQLGSFNVAKQDKELERILKRRLTTGQRPARVFSTLCSTKTGGGGNVKKDKLNIVENELQQQDRSSTSQRTKSALASPRSRISNLSSAMNSRRQQYSQAREMPVLKLGFNKA